ncbi:hypothetical protein AYO38_07880 [bacterium SCGC AG-212-C10]|nr:hypothetical protein AYO38_07880 [bacterium SCGC AG-212-C10]
MTECSWQAPAAGSGVSNELLGAEIIRWVRSAMGEMRRPYGVNQVVLALAVRDAEGQVLCTNGSGVQRPEMFYGREGEERILGFLTDMESVPSEKRHEVVCALLSLGDLAYALQGARAA